MVMTAAVTCLAANTLIQDISALVMRGIIRERVEKDDRWITI